MSKVKFYKRTSDFTKDLYTLGFSEAEVLDMLAEEEPHLNTARELGYKADFCIVFSDPVKCIFRPAVHIYDIQKVLDSDLKKILSAPKNPSEIDMKRLKSLEALE